MKKCKRRWICIIIAMFLLSGCSSTSQSVMPLDTSTIESKTVESKILGKSMAVNVYLPAGYDAKHKYPVLYMFHGFGGGNGDWFNGYGLAQQFDALLGSELVVPGIIVCPNIENSYGVNSFEGPAKVEIVQDGNENVMLNVGQYEDYIVKELIPFIEKNYSANKEKEKRYIGGFSMGGFTALHLAFTYPELFSKVGGHAPSLRPEGVEMSPLIQKLVYPDQAAREKNDPLMLAKKQAITDLNVYLDIGSEDMPEKLRQTGTEDLFKTLQGRKIVSQYSLNPGGHNGEYISGNATKYLTFYFGK
jgi:enterochelin esterase-like enzyme